MSQISRRTLIKASAATAAAAAAVAAPGAASAEMMESPKEHPGYPAAKESAAIFPENPLPESDLSLTGSFNLGKAQLNEGESITAFRWGIVRPVVKGGRIVGCKPFEHDYQPSVNLQGIAEMPYSTARIRYPMVRESYLKMARLPARHAVTKMKSGFGFPGIRPLNSQPKQSAIPMTTMARPRFTVPHTAGCQPGSSTPLFRVSIVF